MINGGFFFFPYFSINITKLYNKIPGEMEIILRVRKVKGDINAKLN